MRSNLTLRQLRYVCEVARLQNVLAASKALMISTSSILAAIDAAEAEAGTRIFNRFPAKGIRITPAGARFVGAAMRLLAAETEFSRATGDISERFPKPLRIGCFEPFGTLLLPNLLRDVGKLPPEERGPVGKGANQARQALQAAVDARQAELEAVELESRLAADVVDVTLPGTPVTPAGHLHILTATRREIEDVFVGLVEGADVPR